VYLLGHVGISLLLFGPLAEVLLSTGQPLVAVLTGLLVVALAPLPDLDTYTDRLAHRGPTHTVWFALGVGLLVGLVAGLGMLLWNQYISSDPLLPAWIPVWFGSVSALAVVGHLLGDLVTPMGLWPFRPVSDRHYTVDLTPSKSPRANRLCFAAGSLALLAAVVSATL
jgi:inner membrane protein